MISIQQKKIHSEIFFINYSLHHQNTNNVLIPYENIMPVVLKNPECPYCGSHKNVNGAIATCAIG